MAKGDVHVVAGDKGWRVEVEGTARARSTHTTQAEARQAAREIARRSKSKLLVHGRNAVSASATHTAPIHARARDNAATWRS
jgi:hypothetical protein